MTLEPMHVLIADDDPVHRRLVRGQLLRLGYIVQEVSDGEAAWEALQQMPSQILVTDWVMPGLDGPSLISRLRASLLSGYTYCIVLTAKDVRADVIAGLDAGADDYLIKPVDARELRARLAIGARIVTLEQQLREARDTDSLTGLRNRRAARREAEAFLKQPRHTENPLSLLLMDIDHFKQVNDTYGHDVGDQALRHVAMVCREQTQPNHVVARWGGEEFLLVMPDTSLSCAAEVAEQIRGAISVAPIDVDGEEHRLTVSVGVATTSMGVSILDEVLARADAALYTAKRAGRNRVAIADER